MLKKKVIDVRTSVNGEFIDALCLNGVTTAQLNGVLALAQDGYEVLIIVREIEANVLSPVFEENEK